MNKNFDLFEQNDSVWVEVLENDRKVFFDWLNKNNVRWDNGSEIEIYDLDDCFHYSIDKNLKMLKVSMFAWKEKPNMVKIVRIDDLVWSAKICS